MIIVDCLCFVIAPFFDTLKNVKIHQCFPCSLSTFNKETAVFNEEKEQLLLSEILGSVTVNLGLNQSVIRH